MKDNPLYSIAGGPYYTELEFDGNVMECQEGF